MKYILLALLAAHAEVEMIPDRPSDFNSVIIENPPAMGTEMLDIDVRIDCYGTNLRAVENPMRPTANLRLLVKIEGRDRVGVQFPARLFFPEYGGASKSDITFVEPSDLTGFQKDYDPQTRLLHIRTPFVVASGTVQPNGDFRSNEIPTKVQSVVIEQTGTGISPKQAESNASLAHLGHDGPLRGNYAPIASPDGRRLFIHASFPGAASPGQPWGAGYRGFCSAYYSPLVLFFDDKRPQFTGLTDFPLHELKSKVYWPEAGAPGWFLALDKDGDGRITEAKELFGTYTGKPNGFEMLRELDANKDNAITKADPAFKKLVLWNDANGDGISDKKEMKPLSAMGVSSISLDYEASQVRAVSSRAILREHAAFSFGKGKKGRVIDIWLAPSRLSKN